MRSHPRLRCYGNSCNAVRRRGQVPGDSLLEGRVTSESSLKFPNSLLAQLRRFEHFRTPKWLRLFRLTPKGRHYSEIGGMGPAVILGGGWAGRSSFSFVSKRLRSGSGSV